MHLTTILVSLLFVCAHSSSRPPLIAPPRPAPRLPAAPSQLGLSGTFAVLSSGAPSTQIQLSAESSRRRSEQVVDGKVFTPTDYSVVPGFFQQSDPNFDPSTFNLLNESFGLLPSSTDPHRWSHFISDLNALNARADSFTTYKLLILARHGQGFHNAAETKYGTPLWNEYWSRIEGDGEITWGPDAKLTPLGRKQARNTSTAWVKELSEGAPLPGKWYSSPLSRSAETLRITWGPILGLGEKGSKRPLVKEMLRETIGLHTCDQRSTATQLRAAFPEFDFEVPFSEHDQLWSANFQEVTIQQSLRAQQFLNEVFATDPSGVISFTAHGGTTMAICHAIGHPIVVIQPGEFLPVVVKAVSYPEVRGRNFAGGQSKSAPPLGRPTRAAVVAPVARRAAGRA